MTGEHDHKKICILCEKLGKCNDTSVKMLEQKEGCGSWIPAHPKEIDARFKAIAIAGKRALEALIIKSPPNKPAKEYRR
jgi:hypothetical protein